MKRGVLVYKEIFYDERMVLDKAYNKVKLAHETGKRNYYSTVLEDELAYFSVFMQKWFNLAEVDPKTSVGLAHEQEYERFRAIYHALRHKYELRYRYRNLKSFLQLINDQDNNIFQKKMNNKNFSYLWVEYGVLDYELIDELINEVNISEFDKVTKDKIRLLIDTCNKLEKKNCRQDKIQVELRENVLDPFGQLKGD